MRMKFPVIHDSYLVLKDKPKVTYSSPQLRRIISGAYAGTDIAALSAAKQVGFKTGGHIAEGFVSNHIVQTTSKIVNHREVITTTVTPKLSPGYKLLYGMKDDCEDYAEQVYKNVQEADATLRLGTNFGCGEAYFTLDCIRYHDKPHLDLFFEEDYILDETEVAYWIVTTGARVLYITGCIEQNLQLQDKVEEYLLGVLSQVRWGG